VACGPWTMQSTLARMCAPYEARWYEQGSFTHAAGLDMRVRFRAPESREVHEAFGIRLYRPVGLAAAWRSAVVMSGHRGNFDPAFGQHRLPSGERFPRRPLPMIAVMRR
jgi:hypothetical protein